MSGRPQENSLRGVLKTAYELNADKRARRARRKDAKDQDQGYGNTESKDYSNKFYNIIDGLYCYINGITEPPRELQKPDDRWIKYTSTYDVQINEFTKCIILALMTMDSHDGSFISKLIHKEFDEITNRDKLYYLWCVMEQLKNIELPCSKSFLVHNYAKRLEAEGLNPDDEELLNKVFRQEICKGIDGLACDIIYEMDRVNYENEVKNSVLLAIEAVIEKYFPIMDISAIPYPTPKTTTDKKKKKEVVLDYNKYFGLYFLFGMHNNVEIKYDSPNSPTNNLDPEEKKYMLRVLQNDLLETIEKWERKVDIAIKKRDDCEAEYISDLI